MKFEKFEAQSEDERLAILETAAFRSLQTGETFDDMIRIRTRLNGWGRAAPLLGMAASAALVDGCRLAGPLRVGVSFAAGFVIVLVLLRLRPGFQHRIELKRRS